MELTVIEKIGKRRTILLSISILLVSIHTIYYYHSVIQEIEIKKIVQQIIRFLLTVWLLILIYKGANWARIVMIILAFVAVIGSLISIVTIDQDFVLKTPLLVMAIVYSMAIYFLGFSKSYKAFATFQRMDKSAVATKSLSWWTRHFNQLPYIWWLKILLMKKSIKDAKPLYLYLLSLGFIFLSKTVATNYLILSYVFTGIALAIFILALVNHFKK